MDLWVVNDTIRRSKMRDVPGASADRGAWIRERFGLSEGAGRVSDLPEYQTGDQRYVACLPDLDEQGKQSSKTHTGKKETGHPMENDKTNLDVLRSFAVTTVMVDHLVPTIHTHGLYVNPVVLQFTAHIGQIGVLAFFVHTSLVLMYSLERLAQRPTGGSIATRFYIRRFFRIYPLSIACVAVVLLLGIPPLPWRETPPYGANVIIANLLLVQNLYTGQSVLGPLWSLPYEVEMYILLPLLFFVARKKSGVGSLQLLIAAACAGGIALAFITHGRLNMAAYAPCFLAGVLCYALQSRQKAVLPATLWPLWIVVLIVSYCLLHTQSPRPVYWMGWILCLILGWTINLFRDGRNRAVNVLAHKIALYSYGLYLIHVPVLYLVFDVWRMRNVPAACATYFGLTLLFSVMTYHTLEKPMIDVGCRLSERPTAPAPQAAPGA